MFPEFLNTLRSLTASPVKWSVTASPITRGLQEARRMAQRRLEVGGAVTNTPHRSPQAGGRVASPTYAQHRPAAGDFLVPGDIDPAIFSEAIAERPRRSSTLYHFAGEAPLARRVDGQLIVPGQHVMRLGAGSFARGHDILRQLVVRLRAHRDLARPVDRR